MLTRFRMVNTQKRRNVRVAQSTRKPVHKRRLVPDEKNNKVIVIITAILAIFIGTTPISAQSDEQLPDNVIRIGEFHLELCRVQDPQNMRIPLNQLSWQMSEDGRSARTEIHRDTLSAWSVSQNEMWITGVGDLDEELYFYGESAEIKKPRVGDKPRMVDLQCLDRFEEFPFMALPPNSCPSDYMKAIEIFGGRIGMWTPMTEPGVSPAVMKLRVAEEMIFMLPYKTYVYARYPEIQEQPIFGPGTTVYATHGTELTFVTKCGEGH